MPQLIRGNELESVFFLLQLGLPGSAHHICVERIRSEQIIQDGAEFRTSFKNCPEPFLVGSSEAIAVNLGDVTQK